MNALFRETSNKHVARFFKIAEPTVKAHVKAILRKIGANNRTQAATWALSNRVFDHALDATGDLAVAEDHALDR